MRPRRKEAGKGAWKNFGIEWRREKKRTRRDNVGDRLAGAAVVPRGCSRVKPSPGPRKVEGPDSRTKAKDGSGKRRDNKDIPSGEARSRPKILEKHLVHSDNHGIGVSDPRVS
jgi:hypothetical protein